MKCYENFSMFQDQQTPLGIQNIPDEIKTIALKSSPHENFDIILSKYFNNEELTDIQLQQLNQHQKITFQEIRRKSQTKTKRPDEYQKLFFKKAFKFAQHAFFKKNKKNKSRKMSQFYHHHFDCVVHTLKIPLINFYHPDRKTKPGLSTGQKSFNSSYVKTILKSSQFRKICIEYHSRFKEDCRKQRNKKILTFRKSVFDFIEKNKQDRTKLIKFLQSSKCKIPWTDKQIDQAFRKAGEDLDDYTLKSQQQFIQNAKQKSWMEILDENQHHQSDDIQYLHYNDEKAQEQTEKHMFKIIETFNSSSEKEFSLRINLDLMKI